MKNWLIKLLGGYPIKNKEDRHLILTEAVKELYNTIAGEDILQENKNGWRFMDNELSDAETQQLIAESINFINSRLWKILQKDIKYQANKRMYLLSQSIDDLIMGKSWLYVLDCINTRLKAMQKGVGTYGKKPMPEVLTSRTYKKG